MTRTLAPALGLATLATLGLAAAHPAQAQAPTNDPLANAGFESPSSTSYTTSIDDWTPVDPSGNGIGTAAYSYISEITSAPPDPGNQFAFINGDAYIYQNSNVVLQAGTTYTFSAYLIERTDDVPDGSSLELLAGDGSSVPEGGSGQILVTGTTPVIPAGGYTLASLSYTATAADAGQDLFVRLNNSGTNQGDFDNVSLNMVLAPEPSQFAGLGVGLLGLGGLALQARKRRA